MRTAERSGGERKNSAMHNEKPGAEILKDKRTR